MMTTESEHLRPPFICGPLNGQLAENFRPSYRSAETGARIPTSSGDRAAWRVCGTHGGMFPKRIRRMAARIYQRDEARGGYVWLPVLLGIDMQARWVPYWDGPMQQGHWWASAHVRFRD